MHSPEGLTASMGGIDLAHRHSVHSQHSLGPWTVLGTGHTEVTGHFPLEELTVCLGRHFDVGNWRW